MLYSQTNAMDTEIANSENFVTYLRNKNKEKSHATKDKEQSTATRRIEQENAQSSQEDATHPVGRTQKKQDPGESVKKKKEEKPPPFNILYQNPRDTEKLILSELGQVRFLIKEVNNNKHTLQMFSETDYYKAKKLLELANTCFYTHPEKR